MIILYSFVSSTTAIYTLSLHDALPISYRILRRLGLEDITIDYLIVDPLRVDRETFKAIWTAWRDGFADTVAAHTSVTRDRKSTRLNSSHLGISYAVFCLKKKKLYYR